MSSSSSMKRRVATTTCEKGDVVVLTTVSQQEGPAAERTQNPGVTLRKQRSCIVSLLAVFLCLSLLCYNHNDGGDVVGSIVVGTATNKVVRERTSSVSSFRGVTNSSRTTPTLRQDRFPSVEDRVRLYMSNWYYPPCNGTGTTLAWTYLTVDDAPAGGNAVTTSVGITSVTPGKPKHTRRRDIVRSKFRNERVLLVHRVDMRDCARHVLSGVARGQRSRFAGYCQDVLDLLEVQDGLSSRHTPPLFTLFGDHLGDTVNRTVALPVVTKFRGAATREDLDALRRDAGCVHAPRPVLRTSHVPGLPADHLSPILWKLNTKRHFAPVEEARTCDTPWRDKRDAAVWRGMVTGIPHVQHTREFKAKTVSERCRSIARCRFVLDRHHQQRDDVTIDAALTPTKRMRNFGLPAVIDGVTVLATATSSLKDLQRYKILISLEGNDVASGLKWMLHSNSVVLMAPPTRTSWAMEELLEPWVHYVPMAPDGSDAEDGVRWVLDHDDEAERIAQRATLFMEDLLYHPDAAGDERAVKREIVRRYHALWG